MDKPKETFRAAFGRVGCVFGVVLALALALMLAGFWLRGGPGAQPRLLIVCAAGAAGVCVAAAVVISLFPVYVGPQGLRAYNLWGVYRNVPWSEIASVERLNVFGLRYLVVRCKPAGTIYVPLFLSRPEQFRQRVAALAGATHPLAKALEGEPR